jgi:hypothetical protein
MDSGSAQVSQARRRAAEVSGSGSQGCRLSGV